MFNSAVTYSAADADLEDFYVPVTNDDTLSRGFRSLPYEEDTSESVTPRELETGYGGWGGE